MNNQNPEFPEVSPAAPITPRAEPNYEDVLSSGDLDHHEIIEPLVHEVPREVHATELAADIAAGAAQDTPFEPEFELSLEDEFLKHEADTRAPAQVDVPVEQKVQAEALPSVLVDEVLMSEIASIPDRFGFKIGDVADLLGIKQYVLRYWEQEFEILKPKKASNNQRLYTKKDVENAFLIKKLLYRDKFSIEGARQALKDVKFAVKKEKDLSSVIQRMDYVQDQIRNFVTEIRKTKNLFN